MCGWAIEDGARAQRHLDHAEGTMSPTLTDKIELEANAESRYSTRCPIEDCQMGDPVELGELEHHFHLAALDLWHQPVQVESDAWPVAGWFVCSESAGDQAAMPALKWQWDHSHAVYPDPRWVVVIHRPNEYVQTLNCGLCSTEVWDRVDPAHEATHEIFPDADPKEFSYVCTTG